jgi:hypothetical protein
VEALRQLRTRLQPSLVRAFRLGEASDTGVQTLSEIMAMGSGFHVPGSPSVFYNVYRPALPDAELLRFEGQLWGKGKASLSVSTRP